MSPSWTRRLFKKSPRDSKAPGSIGEKDRVTSDEGSIGNHKPGQGELHDDDDKGFGMHVLIDKPPKESGLVDFVALHGLNGHYQRTWTANSPGGTQVNWLKDLLPTTIPNARVISFGYNSIVQFSKGTAGISEFAEQLLEGLMVWRTSLEEKRQPVVFICHSLGGIVFKQAVVKAQERDRFTGLLEYIQGVAFFGTPHRGSPAASFKAIFASILKISTLSTNTNSKLVSQLKNNAPTLLAINSSFVNRTKNLAIISFYETEKMDYMNKLVVERHSAVMEVQGEVSIGLNANHHTICKFLEAGDDGGFRMVSSPLKGMVETILEADITSDPATTLEPEAQNKCLQSFYHKNYDGYMNRNPDRVPGTCEWLLQHEKYLQWIADVSRSELLWVSADPGCGKSVLAKFLVSHLRVRSPGHQRPRVVSHFFFKDDNEGQRSAVFALRAVLHQIFSHDRVLLRHAFRDYLSKGAAMVDDFDSLWGILSKVAFDPAAKDVVLILDALDECEAQSQRRLLAGLRKWFSNNHSGVPCFRIIIFSRPNIRIEDTIASVATVRLRREDEPESISNDVELVIRDQIGHLASKGFSSEDLSWLQDSLVKKTDRTFLWTALMIDLLLDAARSGVSRKELEDLLESRDLDEIYVKLLSRDETKSHREKTMKMLRLILAAAEPLTLKMLNVAIAADPKHNSLEDFRRDLKSDMGRYIKYLCGNFVRIIRSKVFLVHQTAREFLLQRQTTTSHWYRQISMEDSHDALLRSCVSTLYLMAFASPNQIVSPDSVLHELRAFFKYASQFWAIHLDWGSVGPVEIFNQIVDNCLAICVSKFGPQKTWKCRWLPAHNVILLLADWEFSPVGEETGWATREMEQALTRLMSQNLIDIDACDSPSSGTTLLHHAARRGKSELIQTLLDHNADISLKDRDGDTPLHLFIKAERFYIPGKELAVRRFLKMYVSQKADIDAKNNQGETLLHLVVEGRLDKALEELLEIGADATIKTRSGDDALRLARRQSYLPGGRGVFDRTK